MQRIDYSKMELEERLIKYNFTDYSDLVAFIYEWQIHALQGGSLLREAAERQDFTFIPNSDMNKGG